MQLHATTESRRSRGGLAPLLAAEHDLVDHPLFGDSAQIAERVLERYRFGVELFAERCPAIVASSEHVAALADADATTLFRDPVLRLALEQAFERLEAGTLSSPDRVEELLPLALGAMARSQEQLCLSRMRPPVPVGSDATMWLWNLPERGGATDSVLDTLWGCFESVSRGDRATLLAADCVTAQQVERACTLLRTTLPEIGPSVLGHITAIAIVDMSAEGGRLLSASGGDLIPSSILLSRTQLDDPWDAAGHLLHEGLHLKLFDIVRSHTLVRAATPMVDIPWRNIQWSIVRVVFAFHVYVHIVLFKKAVERDAPALTSRFGVPSRYAVTGHAMSVASASSASPYASAADRTRFLAEQLQGAWSAHLTEHGRRLVEWLVGAIEAIS
ncbi:MAG: HEXXH motif-containing putative peptide modification protein [Kofleriaceae bacterium]